jgi:hypothetical protein
MEKEYKTNIASEQYASSDVESGVCTKPSLQREPGFRGWLKSLSVETGGIERVTEEDRKTNTSEVWHACTFW